MQSDVSFERRFRYQAMAIARGVDHAAGMHLWFEVDPVGATG